MKIVFVENRQKTYLYESIADKLLKDDHEIIFLIQNNGFKPSNKFKNYFIKYPNIKRQTFEVIDYVEKIIQVDRQVNHFKAKDKNYFYYYDTEIKKFLKSIKPNIIFGESTAFHELLTLENCKKMDIPYLNPSTCRYPVGRFSFYKYNTLNPFKGSGEILSNKKAFETVEQIVGNKVKPNYMKMQSKPKKEILSDRLNKIFQYTKGERFNTPNPVIKFQLEKETKKNIKSWNERAKHKIPENSNFKILYPLQMQPEANIDVWGRRYRNQTELIKSISALMPNDCILYVKPNPKSKYELTSELIDIVHNTSNIKHLHHSTKMSDVLSEIDLVVTVTGTIAIECIFNDKPIITLTKTLNNEADNCKYVSNLDKDLLSLINKVKDQKFPTISNQEKIDFINKLNRTSYKGIISDPFSDMKCIADENINYLYTAFNDILKDYEN